VLQGWRFDVFGKDALDLVEGKLAFAVERGRLKMTHIDDVVVPETAPAAEMQADSDADADPDALAAE